VVRLLPGLLILFLAACEAEPPETTAHKRAWTIMGTTLEITVYRPEEFEAATDLAAAYGEIEAIDRLMSLYRTDSELSVLNAAAGGPAMAVSSATRDMLDASRHFWQISGGAFDAAVKPLIDAWGFYDAATAFVPADENIAAALAVTGMEHVRVNQEGVALDAGSALDFGAIAKGYAVDRALAALTARGATAAMVNLGGTIGVTGPHPDGSPWRIGLQHPRQDALLGTVELTTGAAATSGDYDRFFVQDGTRYSHIVDPRTGRPVAGMASVSVIAPNATTADALSTAAFVLGAADGLALLNDCAGIAGIVAAINDGTIVATSTDSAGILSTTAPAVPRASTERVCVWSAP
jgi:thiamine biosynthesis lipoprotein